MGRRRALAVLGAAVLSTFVTAGSATASNDPEFDAFQYGPQRIYAPEAWTVTRGEGVTIAIVDSGVQLDHPDLRDKIVPGYDFADDDAEPYDEHGHGTHVAGIAAAVTDNGIGIAGIAPAAKIMPLRVPVVQSTGDATTVQALLAVSEAVRYAVSNGAEVINLSIGGESVAGPGFDEITTACRDALASGAVCVTTSGNFGRSRPSGYASDFPGIVVGATDRKDEIADFSQNADTQWAVVAPGVAIHSSWLDSGYRAENGTSMAAPHVAGVAALLFSLGLSSNEVIERIVSTARPLNDGGGLSGAGLVNAAAAVGAEYTPTTTAPPRLSTTTTVAAGGGGTRPSLPTTPGAEPETPVDLTEGVIEDDEDFTGEVASEGFLTGAGAIGEDPEPIDVSDGYTAAFLTMIAVFLAGLAAIGLVLRRLVLRRGIGQMRADTT